MFQTYLKTALRNISRGKTYSLINIVGLSVGMGACILISLWVKDELSFDRFHRNVKSIFRVISYRGNFDDRSAVFEMFTFPFSEGDGNTVLFISCLGAFGLALYTTETRTKQIGIRKVLGASVCSILALLTGEFVKWVLLSNVIAWPVAWYSANRWLQDFAYRTDLSWVPFLGAGFLVLVIAILTVMWQAVRAATANPVGSMRYE